MSVPASPRSCRALAPHNLPPAQSPDLPATPPLNVYTDQNADARMQFYRIMVRPVE